MTTIRGQRPRAATARSMVAAALAAAAWVVLALASCEGWDGLRLVVETQRDGRRLLSVPVSSGDRLEFEWIHSVERFPWYEYFELEADGSLFLRETRIGGFGAGVPYDRGTSASVEDGFVVYRGIDERFPSYRWINSSTAVAAISINGTVVARGTDFPHHEALELRVTPRR
ncbi:MAG TPA: DUF1850 domain-containing protein [Spirochaetales bacterium]|nr:DUF1850 domain-containing protein [Spirochaetales bacterium]